MFACELKDAYGKIPTELPEQFQNEDGEIIKLVIGSSLFVAKY